MYIKTLELSDFRNYDNLSINFGQDTNILYGDNAQGKTNVLESVYLAATTRSHRGSKDKEIIRFGKEEAHIKMIVMKNEVPVRIDMHLKKNKPKGIAVNGIPLKRASELFGILNVVFFSPEDLNVIKNGPAERRKFIDTELCQLDKIYLQRFRNYEEPRETNERIFQFRAYANNRDGLALKTVCSSLVERPEKNKILIVLSDGKPCDMSIQRPGTRQPNTGLITILSKDCSLKTAH